MSGNANWSDPVLTSLYTSVLDMLKDRDVDAATMFNGGTATNVPTGAIRFNRGNGMFQEWNGATWNNVSLGGFGTMSAQNSNAVNITGGTISGVTAPASIINSGEIPLNRGGTGASLSLGSSGKVLQSNGASVIFGTDGSALTGVVWANINKTVSSLADLTTKSAADLTTGLVASARLGTGGGGAGAKVLADNQTFITPPGSLQLLQNFNGLYNTVGLHKIATITFSGANALTALDKLLVVVNCRATVNDVNAVSLNNNDTDNLHVPFNILAGDYYSYQILLQPGADSNTVSFPAQLVTDRNYTPTAQNVIVLTTGWTNAWALSLQLTVTSGAQFYYNVSYFKVLGQ